MLWRVRLEKGKIVRIRNIFKAFCVLLLSVLAGCVTVGSNKLDDVNNFLKLKEQQSTKIDVYRIFGQPHDVRTPGAGDTVWVYYEVYSRPSAWTFIPYVGLAAGGSVQKKTFAYFDFSKSGVLQKMITSSDKGYENMWPGLGHALSNIHDKSPAQRVREEMQEIGKPFDESLAKRVSGLRDK